MDKFSLLFFVVFGRCLFFDQLQPFFFETLNSIVVGTRSSLYFSEALGDLVLLGYYSTALRNLNKIGITDNKVIHKHALSNRVVTN